MAAAIGAVEAGLTPLVLDENPQPGGRLLAAPPPVLRPPAARPSSPADWLLQRFRLARNKMDYQPASTILGFFGDHEVAYLQHGRLRQCRYQALIVAAGAYDRPAPIPGWTLPGVLTAGGALNLIKQQGTLPGKNILLAGSGPLQMALASRISESRGRITGIAEASCLDWLGLIQAFLGNFDLLVQGLKYLFSIKRRRIPIWTGHILTRIHGNRKVERATIAKVDSEWRPVQNSQRTISVDAICMGYGLVPSTEITRMLKCKHVYDLKLGGWVPVRDKFTATSKGDVFAAGDCTGISGGAAAILEGAISAVSAAHILGKITRAKADEKRKSMMRRLRSLRRFIGYIQNTCYPRRGLFELPDDDTIVCRCEELTLKDIHTALADAPPDINEFKRATRTSMGRCQGRMCGPFIQEIMAAVKGVSPGCLGSLYVRPPIKPAQLSSLKEETLS